MNITVRDAANQLEALAHLLRAQAYAVDDSGLEDLTRGCMLLDIEKGSRVVGAVAVDVDIERSVATITAAASEGDFANEEWPLLEQGLGDMGMTRVAFNTRRVGLIRQMERRGFQIIDCRMEKVLHRG